VRIFGSGCGAAQGTGAAPFCSTSGSVVNWNNTQIVATVAANAQSGNAQVQQGGL